MENLRSSDYKAPGGKLVRVRLKEEHGEIRTVKITGDFFLTPEESQGKLEKRQNFLVEIKAMSQIPRRQNQIEKGPAKGPQW